MDIRVLTRDGRLGVFTSRRFYFYSLTRIYTRKKRDLNKIEKERDPSVIREVSFVTLGNLYFISTAARSASTTFANVAST